MFGVQHGVNKVNSAGGHRGVIVLFIGGRGGSSRLAIDIHNEIKRDGEERVKKR